MGWRKVLRSLVVFSLIAIYFLLAIPSRSFVPEKQPLATHVMPLNDRYGNSYVNNVFKDNILLTLAYATGFVHDKSDINWQRIEKAGHFNLILQPGDVFAFHDDILADYENKPIKTTNAHFSSDEGFLSDGYLFGDGVCHLASLINWTAKDAGLNVLAPTLHSFAVIPDIPAQYGVSIYASESQKGSNQRQNLYIENKFKEPVVFAFNYEGDVLNLSIYKDAK